MHCQKKVMFNVDSWLRCQSHSGTPDSCHSHLNSTPDSCHSHLNSCLFHSPAQSRYLKCICTGSMRGSAAMGAACIPMWLMAAVVAHECHECCDAALADELITASAATLTANFDFRSSTLHKLAFYSRWLQHPGTKSSFSSWQLCQS
jgi:hypothetical protein